MPDRLTQNERRLVVNAIAGVAYTMLDLSKKFPKNPEAQVNGFMAALAEITPMLAQGDPSAFPEVVSRISSAIKEMQGGGGSIAAPRSSLLA